MCTNSCPFKKTSGTEIVMTMNTVVGLRTETILCVKRVSKRQTHNHKSCSIARIRRQTEIQNRVRPTHIQRYSIWVLLLCNWKSIKLKPYTKGGASSIALAGHKYAVDNLTTTGGALPSPSKVYTHHNELYKKCWVMPNSSMRWHLENVLRHMLYI